MMSSSLRTLDGLGASGSSARTSSTDARRRRNRISMIWLSRRVRSGIGDIGMGGAKKFAHGEYIRARGACQAGPHETDAGGSWQLTLASPYELTLSGAATLPEPVGGRARDLSARRE